MMGKAQAAEQKLFYTNFNLADRISQRNPLKAVAAVIDFTFVRCQVQHLYGYNGNESIDPAVILKLFFLLFFEKVPSARLLMDRLPERLDWIWFCGYDLDSTLPDHSVLSKARCRWGRQAFASFFKRVLEQCVAAGLVDGQVLHVDGSLISANASMDSLGPRLEIIGGDLYDRLDREEHELLASTPVSSTDSDARLRRKRSKLVLGYQEVRSVDDQNGIITATVTADAAADEASQLEVIIEQHQENVGSSPHTVVADKGFGTAENYKQLRENDILPCIPHPSRSHRQGRIPQSSFTYDKRRDCYICPQGNRLPYSCHVSSKRADIYQAPAKVCAGCQLKAQCSGKRGRVIYRHEHQETIQWADSRWSRQHRRRLMRRRMHVMEGSFADAANCHGYKRARWRRLESVTIQNLLIAAIQNVRKLLKHVRCNRAAASQRQKAVKTSPQPRMGLRLWQFFAAGHLPRVIATRLAPLPAQHHLA